VPELTRADPLIYSGIRQRGMVMVNEPVCGTDLLRVHLPDAVSERLRREFEQAPDCDDDLEALLARLVQASTQLPLDILKCLLRFRAAPQAPSALLLTGMPIDEYIPLTPTKPESGSFKVSHVSECAILFVAILLGEPVAYAAEKGGALVQNVFPIKAERTSPSNESSAVPLPFHTEITFSRTAPAQSFDVGAPDFVLLLGLRSLPSRSAATSLIDARDLCRRLEPHHLAILREPQFQLCAPYSFTERGAGSRPWSDPLALFRGSGEAPRIVFDIACGVRGLSSEAEAALSALANICADPTIQRSVRLGPGDLLVIDNTRCAHARSSYEARFDGHDRWLQRAYVRRDIRTLTTEAATSFRVLA
jgi:L-asparagine oxygenase